MKRSSACSCYALTHAACPLFMPTMTLAACTTHARAPRPEHPRNPGPGPYRASKRSENAAMNPACSTRMIARPEGRVTARAVENAPSRAPWARIANFLSMTPLLPTGCPPGYKTDAQCGLNS